MPDLGGFFKVQEDFLTQYHAKNHLAETDQDKTRLVLFYLERVKGEAGEAQSALKGYLAGDKTRQEYVTELVDAFKFLLNAGIMVGVTPEEFNKVFTEKSQMVERRLL